MRRLLLLIVLLAGVPANARDLDVPPTKGWQHAATGLILMPRLADESRTALTDSGDQELDVAAQYGTGEGDVSITVYLFHPGLDDVALWFDRIDTAVHERSIYGGAIPTAAVPIIFNRPGSDIADSLRMTYAPAHGPYRATAAALMPLGDWLVSVRISSKIDDPAALTRKLDAVIAGIRFPPAAAASSAVMPIADCTSHVDYRHGRLMKPDSSQILLGALAGVMIAKKGDVPPKRIVFCRDGAGTTPYGVYREDDASQQYWIAFNDAGQAAYVGSGVAGLLGKGGFQVSLLTFGGTSIYQSFDKLPEPKQVVALIQNTAPASKASGKNITVDVK